jgi:hypothetical protein
MALAIQRQAATANDADGVRSNGFSIQRLKPLLQTM